MTQFGYPSTEPCRVCGGFKDNQSEPRFGYTVCADHQNVPPVDIPPYPGAPGYDKPRVAQHVIIAQLRNARAFLDALMAADQAKAAARGKVLVQVGPDCWEERDAPSR